MNAARGEETRPLALDPDPEEIVRRIGYWLPNRALEPGWSRRRPASSLRIAAICGERLWQGLRHEAHLFPLTPGNWRLVLKHGGIDLLLIESCWETVTGHWYLAQSGKTPEAALLHELLAFAGRAGLPRAFWNTCDHAWHAHYREFARCFDQVFCADEREAEALRAAGVAAELLPPAVQPAVFNPVRAPGSAPTAQFRVLYDGIVDLFRPRDGARILAKLRDRGLAVIDSHGRVFSNRMGEQKGAVRSLLGCVTPGDRLAALHGARIALTLADSHLSRTEQRWQSLEIAACRVPVVHFGPLAADDPRREFATAAGSAGELYEAIDDLQRHDLKRERAAHLAWRHVSVEHGFGRRLDSLCRAAGIDSDRVECPPVTVVTPTFRPNRLAECIRNFDRQNYPQKELVIVFNGEPDAAANAQLLAGRDDIRILGVPRERHTGACMNAGIAAARGGYCFKMDDDDIYGAHYVSDMMLHALALDADILGKPSRYYAFGAAPELHRRTGPRVLELCRVAPAELANAAAWMSGNSLAGRREALLAAPFPDTLYSAADTAFVMALGNTALRVAILDAFNLVTIRSADPSAHTWNARDRLQSRLKQMPVAIDEVLV